MTQYAHNVPARELRAGDRYAGEGGWLAITDAAQDPDQSVAIMVRRLDGGREMRVWDNPDHPVPVFRAQA